MDRDTIVANSKDTHSAVSLYFNELRSALEQREKAVLNTVQKYTDIKLSTLDLYHQKLQEDHMGITKVIDSLETLLQQNNSEVDFSLLVSGHTLEEELEVYEHSVLSLCETLSHAKLADKFLSFSGDQVLLTEPLKEAGVLNECQILPDTNILSMQRVVVSEHEDPYLHVPSRFEDLQASGPQKEVRIDGTKKSQRVMKIDDMMATESVEYVVPRRFLGSFPVERPVQPSTEGLFGGLTAPRKVKKQPKCNGTGPATIECHSLDKHPEPAAQKPPVPPPHKSRKRAPEPPQRVASCSTRPQNPKLVGHSQSSELSPPQLPPRQQPIAMDVYDTPFALMQGSNDDTYDVPRRQSQSPISEDMYDVPRNSFISPWNVSEDNDIYSTPRPAGDIIPPPRPPKPARGTSGLLSPPPQDDRPAEIPKRAPSPKPKPRPAATLPRDYVNTMIPTKNNPPPCASPTAHRPVKKPSNSSLTTSGNYDTRSKPIPAPRPQRPRSKTHINSGADASTPPQQPPQSAPPVEDKSKPVFQWNETPPRSEDAVGQVKTLPSGKKLKRLHSTLIKPLTVLSSKQLSQPAGSEHVYPCGVCCSPTNDMLVVTDVYSHCIRLVDPTAGTVIERVGKEGRSGGQFKEPSAVVMDSNEHIFVAELDNPRVQKFTSRGKYLHKFGQKAFWGSQLHDPYGLTLSPDNKLYITDWEKGRILVYRKDGRHVNTIGKDNAFLKFPAGLVFDKQGSLLVTDRGKHCVWKMSPEGKPISRIGKVGKGEGELLLPHGIAVLNDDTIAVSESGNHRVSIFAPNGTFVRSFGQKGSLPGMFHYPRHMCVNSKGQLIVADENNQRIQIFEV